VGEVSQRFDRLEGPNRVSWNSATTRQLSTSKAKFGLSSSSLTLGPVGLKRKKSEA
jgi:hypothetical protein